MNRRKFIRNIGVATTGLGFTALPANLLAHEDFVTLTILHTNDIHCHIEPFTGAGERYANKGGMARISELAKRTRLENPNTLLFDAGDMFQGTPYFNYFRGDVILQLMSKAGFDAGTIGNHEFDNGLEGILKPLHYANFPIITSNYNFSDTILAGKFPKWKIFNRSGIKVGVYGLGIELKGLVADKNFGTTTYNDPLKVALEMESFLKNEKKCDLVICLSHLGLKYSEEKISDMVLVKETSFTNLIIGGHTHSFVEKPIVEINKKGRQVIVNQAWWGGLVVGRIDFVLERSRGKKEMVLAENIKNQ